MKNAIDKTKLQVYNYFERWYRIMSKDNETKRERFVRLAENRTNKIINMVQLLGNCSNTSIYEYSDSDIDQIFTAIENAVRDAKRKFTKTDAAKNSKFTLR